MYFFLMKKIDFPSLHKHLIQILYQFQKES